MEDPYASNYQGFRVLGGAAIQGFRDDKAGGLTLGGPTKKFSFSCSNP